MLGLSVCQSASYVAGFSHVAVQHGACELSSTWMTVESCGSVCKLWLMNWVFICQCTHRVLWWACRVSKMVQDVGMVWTYCGEKMRKTLSAKPSAQQCM